MGTVPIAVVGIGFRFPGSAKDSDSFWDLLVEERVTWSRVPDNRFNEQSYNHPERGAPASFTHRGGHFLDEDFRHFDAGFFRLPAAEAGVLDPQQRQLLETTYECIENAGITLEDLKGSNTGVFVASFMHDFENLILKDSTAIPKYSMTGTGLAMCSNRISYFYDLHGPSLTLDTGCSGGLTAVHQGCQSLWLGEVNMSLVGAANVIISPDSNLPLDLSHLLSPQGRCFSFDSRGTGYGRGEGTAVLALKRLDDAVANHDHIRAIIRHSVVSQDGRTRGITMPNPSAQADMIARAYRESCLDPSDVVYIEAHGTGTTAGDTAEVSALKTVFCGNAPRSRPLLIGSVKANIGHLEAASGLASLIKSILILERGLIPGTPDIVNFKQSLDLEGGDIKICRNSIFWPPQTTRRLGINSFGYGGSNAHVILEADTNAQLVRCASSRANSPAVRSCAPVDAAKVIVISGQSESSLRYNIQNLLRFLRQRSSQQLSFQDLVYTLNSKRTTYDFRRTVVAATTSQLIRSLAGEYRASLVPRNQPCIVLVFTGQGAQWPGMANTLLSSCPKFRASLEQSNVILQSLGANWDLVTELSRTENTSRIFESEIGQSCCTAVQIALVDLYRQCGLIPDYVIGHSSGEIAAAFSVGALTHRQALEAAYYRGRTVEEVLYEDARSGAMLAVQAGEALVTEYLRKLDDYDVSIACFNSHTSVTVSGDHAKLDLLQKRLAMHGIPAVFLKTKVAYHSPHMKTVAPRYRTALTDMAVLANSSAETRLFSSVTGEEKLDGFDSEYWVENLVSPVKYSNALGSLLRAIAEEPRNKLSRETVFLEVGPHKTLMVPTMQIISDQSFGSCQYLNSMARGSDCRSVWMEALSKLVEKGIPVNLDTANQSSHVSEPANFLNNLPSYAWDHSTIFWDESRVSHDHRLRRHRYHDLLGLRISGSTDLEPTWRSVISVRTLPWLRDHAVDGKLIFPGAGYLAMALEAKRQILVDRFGDLNVINFVVENVSFLRMLEIDPEKSATELQISLRYPLTASSRGADAVEEFRIISVSDRDGAVEHACGLISAQVDLPRQSERQTPSLITEKDKESFKCLDMVQVYSEMQVMGHLWGPSFACIKSMSIAATAASGTVIVPDIQKVMPGKSQQPHLIHPTTLDSFLHVALMLFAKTSGVQIMFPVSVQKLWISPDMPTEAGESLYFECKIELHDSSIAKFSTVVFNSSEQGPRRPLVEIETGVVRGTRNGNDDLDRTLLRSCPFWVLKQLERPEFRASSVPLSPTSETLDVDLEKVARLNRLALQNMNNTLHFVDASQVVPRYHRYLDWMRAAVHDQSISHDDSSTPFSLIEEKLLSRLGHALPTILTGSTDPFQLLYQDGLVSEFYDASLGSDGCYQTLAELVRYLAFKNPKLRILEIGAGTGALTARLLSSLQGHDLLHSIKYEFTDVSSGFFDTAKVKLEALAGCIEFRKLDLTVSAAEQGFEAGQYDLVVAANALHVTKSIPEVLKQIKTLLTPGGTIAFVEITKLASYINSIFGLFPGWYQDWNDGRQDSPIVSIEKWNSLLIDCEYVDIEYSSTTQDADHQMSVIVGRNSQKTDRLHVNGLQNGDRKHSREKVSRLQRCIDTFKYRQGVFAGSAKSIRGQNGLLGRSSSDNLLFAEDDTLVLTGASLIIMKVLVSILQGQGARHFILLSSEMQVNGGNSSQSMNSDHGRTLQIFSTKKPREIELFCQAVHCSGSRTHWVSVVHHTEDTAWSDEIRSLTEKLSRECHFLSVFVLTMGINELGTMATDYLSEEEFIQLQASARKTGPATKSLACLRINSIEGLSVATDPLITRSKLSGTGLRDIDRNDLAALFRTAVLSDSSIANPIRLVGGISPESYNRESNKTDADATSRLIHVTTTSDLESAASKAPTAACKRSLKEAENRSDAISIVIEALAQKVSVLTAVRREMIDFHTPIDELGMDSLNTYTMSSYIERAFEVDLTQKQISESRGLLALAETIVQASPFNERFQDGPNGSLENPAIDPHFDTELHIQNEFSEAAEFPQQPLPDLESTFSELREGIAVKSTQEDLDRLQRCIELDRASLDHLQQKLEGRYRERSNGNWFTGLYTSNRFLKARSGLVPGMTYFGTHPSAAQQSQAERAAVVCLAAYTFRRKLLAGQCEEIRLGSQLLDPSCQKFLFDSCREPGIDEDSLVKHEDSRHMIVLVRGHAYKLTFPGFILAKNLPELHDVFQELVHHPPSERSLLGALTAGNRNNWYNVRQKLQVDEPDIGKTINAIESAMFVICLDDTRPTTVTERYRQFLWPGSYNRWFDKTVQFVVCENGESATILEHSAHDGVAMQLLHDFLHSALSEEHTFQKSKADVFDGGLGLRFERLSMPDPDSHKDIWAMATEILEMNIVRANNSSMAAVEVRDLGRDFLDSRRFPAQSGIQLAIQLAGRRFYGENVYSMETVSLSHFRDGRVETNPVLRPAMAKYLDTMDDNRNANLSPDQKQSLVHLAREACREHTKYLYRASQGRGFGRHLLALEWVMKPDEDTVPSIFSDPLYKYSKAAKVLTSYFPTGWREGGLLYMVPGGTLVYFEIKPDSVCFSVFGNEVSAEEFAQELEQACADVRDLLISEPVHVE